MYAGDPFDAPIALKFFGRCESVSTDVLCELQVVSSLVGAFWDVEHTAVYKTSPELQGVMDSLSMKVRYRAVLTSLREFEIEFERLLP